MNRKLSRWHPVTWAAGMMGLFLFCVGPGVLMAQAAEGNVAVDPATGQGPTMMALFNTSPTINGIIMLLSIIALLLFLFFLVTVNSSTMAPHQLVDNINKLVLDRKYDEAAKLCRSNDKVFIASVIQRCVENAGKQHSVIMDMVDTEGRRRAEILWNRISYLADIANVAPMLGLLGTVVGMIHAFFAMKFESLSAESGMLTSSIGAAMATTMFGLSVGILATVFYSLVKARVTKNLAVAEQVVHTIADHIKRGDA